MKKRCGTLLILVIISSLLLFSSCVEEQPKEPKIDTIENQKEMLEEVVEVVNEKTEDNEDSNQEQEIKEFAMSAEQWEFTPSTITVNEGDKVILRLTSKDVKHGFVINEFNINVDINPGQTVDVEFIADKKGEFEFYCSVQCGAGHSGMNGKLIVS
tara:strand:+ start:2163 stop:2630 length:468 start_codon:yes stop_codon:yes gene_type:complete